MQNFTYNTPTRLVFGREVIEGLPEALRPYGTRVLLTYGGGSIKATGLYDRVRSLLDGFQVYELSGIAPNPRYASVLEGARLCREHNIDVLLSVGGGSVLDCTKAIAAAARYDGDAWDLITGRVKAQDALPIVDVMTLAATGSEYDMACVISRPETNDKVGYLDPLLFPKVSFLDPRYTMSVPPLQTAAGVADAINQVLETWFCEDHNMVADGIAIGLLKTLVAYGPVAVQHPDNYEARAEVMLAAAFACNGITAMGATPSGWPMHAIEHALSAYYDITHGVGLAIVTPRWMRYILSERTLPRFLALGNALWGIEPDDEPQEAALAVASAFEELFADMGIPMTLPEVGIDGTRLHEMAQHIAEEGLDNPKYNYVPLSVDDIETILRHCLV